MTEERRLITEQQIQKFKDAIKAEERVAANQAAMNDAIISGLKSMLSDLERQLEEFEPEPVQDFENN